MRHAFRVEDVISCDTNLLFYALNARAPEQPGARAFFDAHADSAAFVICELVLIELYGLLRNPVTRRPPLAAAEAVRIIDRFRHHPTWRLVDYPGPPARVMDEVWRRAGAADFPRRAIFDARLAVTLRHHGVTEFATRNTSDFGGFGFQRVWYPLAEPGSGV
jgi:uncharacterized protein